MSFVAIPEPDRAHASARWLGGLIVHYLHWSVVFFVNIPVGLLGLLLVYLHLPDYREAKTHRLDIAGLVLFGAGIALLSYVLEVFGEHRLTPARDLGLLAISRAAARGLRLLRPAHAFPLLNSGCFASAPSAPR